MSRRCRWGAVVVLGVVGAFALAACQTSDDEERLAAQRLFRNYLIQQNASAQADVRIQQYICATGEGQPSGPCDAAAALPPGFPLHEELTLLGSAFTDTETTRELIVGWESDATADTLYDFYRVALEDEPWSIVRDPRIRAIDFIAFRDADNPAFEGELRIAQEGDDAVLILIARERLERS